MVFGIFNVRTNVNACDCTRGCADTERESALKVDSGRKIPCRTGESNLRQRRAGPTLCKLSYIPTLFRKGHSQLCTHTIFKIVLMKSTKTSHALRHKLSFDEMAVFSIVSPTWRTLTSISSSISDAISFFYFLHVSQVSSKQSLTTWP